MRLRTELSADTTELVRRLCALAVTGLPRMYRPDTDQFAFTRAAAPPGRPQLRGVSERYAAIVALGANRLVEERQRTVLRGRTVAEFVALLLDRLPVISNLGDAALICWAAASTGDPRLPQALARLSELDDPARPSFVVEASWVVSALATARPLADVEAHLARARIRLLSSRHADSPLFPHATGAGLVPWYRSHVACFADQVYPIQALARLHASGDDREALQAAVRCADRIVALQGSGGQWWWHYDARTGALIEGYPVYTVHQHAMAPMALLDLIDAGGPSYRVPIERGLRWITDPPELRGAGGTGAGTGAGTAGGMGGGLVLDDAGLTWRKVYRGDPRKLVRAVRAVSTRIVPGIPTPGVGRYFRPSAVDEECRPYEFGWLLFAWLPGPDADPAPVASAAPAAPAATSEAGNRSAANEGSETRETRETREAVQAEATSAAADGGARR